MTSFANDTNLNIKSHAVKGSLLVMMMTLRDTLSSFENFEEQCSNVEDNFSRLIEETSDTRHFELLEENQRILIFEVKTKILANRDNVKDMKDLVSKYVEQASDLYRDLLSGKPETKQEFKEFLDTVVKEMQQSDFNSVQVFDNPRSLHSLYEDFDNSGLDRDLLSSLRKNMEELIETINEINIDLNISFSNEEIIVAVSKGE